MISVRVFAPESQRGGVSRRGPVLLWAFAAALLLVAVVDPVVVPAQALPAGPKFALVIGNSNYRYIPPLVNPVNDATDVSAALRSIGVEVESLLDGSIEAMEAAVEAFSDRLRANPNAVGIFFYAGHAVQSGGVNYLLPVDEDIQNEINLRRRSLSAQDVLRYLDTARNAFNMVVLDACRDDPFAEGYRAVSGSPGRGLAVTASAPPETLVVYATDAGNVAADGTGRNSPFTTAFLSHIVTPGIEVSAMVRRVMADVQRQTNQRQRPWSYSSVTRDVYLTSTAAIPAPTPPAPTPTTATPPVRPGFQIDQGAVRVSVVAAATILVDGQEQGSLAAGQSATLSDIEVGQRSVVARYANGQTESQTVTISVAQTPSVAFSFGFGAIRVSLTSAGAVSLDGVQMGNLAAGQSATLNEVASGSRRVEVRYANGQSETQTVSVSANQTASASFARAWGSLRVGAVTAGTVWVDGANKGSVAAGGSVSLSNIDAGSRRVEVRYANGQSETQTVSVAANQTAIATFARAWGSLRAR